MEDRDLAGRHAPSLALSLLRCAHPPSASRPQAHPTARTGVAADRVAPWRGGTAQILVVQPGPRPQAARSGRRRETALDHRTRLSGTETGIGPGPFRRAWLARLPSSRHTVDCRLWLPGGRAVPFFPLGPRRSSRTISSQTPDSLPAPRLASAQSGIIRTLLPPCASCWPAPCLTNSAAVPSAVPGVHNTVVLGDIDGLEAKGVKQRGE